MTTMVNDKNFDAEVLKSTKPVLVDFFAEWCPPCKAMAPALEIVSKEMASVVKIVKIDVVDPHTIRFRTAAPPLQELRNGAREEQRGRRR